MIYVILFLTMPNTVLYFDNFTRRTSRLWYRHVVNGQVLDWRVLCTELLWCQQRLVWTNAVTDNTLTMLSYKY